MKKALFILVASCLFLCVRCRKEGSGRDIDKRCAKIVVVDVDEDGGHEESGYLPYIPLCGETLDNWLTSAKNQGLKKGIDYYIYYEGEKRPMATYLILDNCRGMTFAWIRYDNNVVPQATINYWKNKGICYTIKKMRFAGDEEIE